MAVRHLLVDKTEIMMMIPQKKKFITRNAVYKDIRQVEFKKFDERHLVFLKKPSEKITITFNTGIPPVVFTYLKEKKYFAEYKSELERFCKDNKVQLIQD